MTRLHSNSPRRFGTGSKRRQVEGGAARPRHCKGDQADVRACRRTGAPASRDPRSSTKRSSGAPANEACETAGYRRIPDYNSNPRSNRWYEKPLREFP